jgi:hypothetical protein
MAIELRLLEPSGEESILETAKGGWPGEELLHPLPVAAMVVLGLNDHWLKGSDWLPGWVTGKLSDFAGLMFFPLFLTALAGTVQFGLFRCIDSFEMDYSLNRKKLLGAIAVSAGIFVPLQFSSWWVDVYIGVLEAVDVMDLFGGFAVTKDPTDLVGLAVLPAVYLYGRGKILDIPAGRLAVIRRRIRRADARGDEAAAIFRRATGDLRSILGGPGKKPGVRMELLDRLEKSFSRYVENERDADFKRAAEALESFRRGR